MGSCNILGAFSSGGGNGENATVVEATTSSTFSTSETDYVDVTGLALTKPNITNGKCFGLATFTNYNNTNGKKSAFALDDNGSEVSYGSNQNVAADNTYLLACCIVDTSDSDGNTLKVKMKVDGGTGYLYYSDTWSIPKLAVTAI